MMSRLNVGSPTARAAATARSTLAGSWVRPSAASTCGTIDCTPIDTRLTPAATYVSNSDSVTSSGLHSTVTSAPGARGIARSTAASPSAGTSDGVPPPTKTLVAGAIPPSTARSTSVRTASR